MVQRQILYLERPVGDAGDDVRQVDGERGVEDLLADGHVGGVGRAGDLRHLAAAVVDGGDHAALRRPEKVAGVFSPGNQELREFLGQDWIDLIEESIVPLFPTPLCARPYVR